MPTRRLLAIAVVPLFVLACGDDDNASTGAGGSSNNGSGGTTTTGSGSGGAGTGGMASGGAGTGGEGAGTMGSEGCGEAATDPSEEWVAKTTVVDGETREWFVWLPGNYDPNTPYPVVYQWHGCSTNDNKQNNNPPVQQQSGDAAIHIRGRAVNDCWAGADDVSFFDALVADVEATWCADVERRFATGYSSGAFMTHRLACDRGDMLRGVATIAGGQSGNNCVGQTAALLIHDDTDNTVSIANSEDARDRHLANNGCDASAPTTPGDHPPCEVYAGCQAGYPVVWCQTTGNGHARQDDLAAPAFWDFLSAL